MKRILILDNDAGILDVLKEAFDYEGFNVDTIFDTDDIIKSINNYKPDVVLLDYILNGINGGELCHQLKNCTTTSHLPVVIMSAYPRVINSLGSYGCNLFIPKPFDLYEMIGQINGLITQSKSKQINN